MGTIGLIQTYKGLMRQRNSAARWAAIIERNLLARQQNGEDIGGAIVDIVERQLGGTWWQQPELWVDDDDGATVYRPCEIIAIDNVYSEARRLSMPGAPLPDEVTPMIRWIADQLYRETLVAAESVAIALQAMYPGRIFSPDDAEVSLELLHERYGELVEAYQVQLREEKARRSTVRRENRERRFGVQQLAMFPAWA